MFSKASGQHINYDKFMLEVSPNTQAETANHLSNLFGIPLRDNIDGYLGLSSFSLRSKRIQFGFLRMWVLRRLESREIRFFFIVGKVDFVKVGHSSFTDLYNELFPHPVFYYR